MERVISERRERFDAIALGAAARGLAPFAVAALLLALGYLWHVPGTARPRDYQSYSYAALNYSDIIWLSIRDEVASHRRPYLDYRLEYPPLTGGLSYLLGFAPSLWAYFSLAYGVLAACALGTIAALGRLPGTNRWYFAAAPALLLYTGLNWDLAAIAMTALALLAYSRDRDRWGTLALVAAVWLKFFPVVFLGAILVERLRARRPRAALAIAGIFALGSAAINLPLARANPAGWGFFFTFNAGRAAEPSLWTLLPALTTARIDALSLLLLAGGGLALTLLALRAERTVALPLGATLLLWWLLVNKVYSPQYALWIFLALALLRPSRSLWQGFVAFDLAYYYASFQILFTVRFDEPALLEWQVHHLLNPLVVLRLGFLGACVGWGALALARRGHPLSWRQQRPWRACGAPALFGAGNGPRRAGEDTRPGYPAVPPAAAAGRGVPGEPVPHAQGRGLW